MMRSESAQALRDGLHDNDNRPDGLSPREATLHRALSLPCTRKKTDGGRTPACEAGSQGPERSHRPACCDEEVQLQEFAMNAARG